MDPARGEYLGTTARGRRSRARGVQRLGRATDRRPVARREAGGRLCAVRADLPGLRQRHRRCVRPRIPGFSPGGLGPHLTSSGFPRGLSSGFPFARRVLPRRPPSPGFPSSGVLRFVPFGRCPGSGSPFGVPPGSLPLGNLHHSAAAGRFRRRWSRAARAKVTSLPPPPFLDLAVIRPAPQMGSRWARWDAAQNRLYERPRAQDTAAPEPPRSAGRRAVIHAGYASLAAWRTLVAGPTYGQPI